MRPLRHLGIIMDGNGRWASQRDLPRKEGHKKGARAATEIIHAAIDEGIEVLSMYAFSTENWCRPEDEVFSIFDILNLYLETEIFDFLKRNVQFELIGDRTSLSLKTRLLLQHAERISKDNTGLKLRLAVNYGGQDEIIRSVRKLAKQKKDLSKLTIEELTDNLDTQLLPQVDLIIRTSGEKRLSNFLIWQAAYAEYYFTDILWPDFSRADLQDALASFGSRERRFGDIKAANN